MTATAPPLPVLAVTGLRAEARIAGMILAAVAMEMIVSSLRVLFPGLAGHG